MNFINTLAKLDDSAAAGGKGASLAKMMQAGIPVPPGFVILATVFESFLEKAGLYDKVDTILGSVDYQKSHEVEQASKKIQALILEAQMPHNIATEIQRNFKKLNIKYVAVRSSATVEDSPTAAWAGQLASYLDTTSENLLENVQQCWASLFTPRAIVYRFDRGLGLQKISVAVVVQEMVPSQKSGVAFSVHPVSQNSNQLIIEAGLGLGEALMAGQITPDSYVVEKQSLRIIAKHLQSKQPILSDHKTLQLAKLVIKIEQLFNFPCDIEWCLIKDNFYIVQSRPITTLTGPKPGKNSPAWVQKSLREGSILEESVANIAKSAVLESAIGSKYRHEIIVHGYGSFTLATEAEKMAEAEKKIRPQFHYIPLVDRLAAESAKLVSQPQILSYASTFELLSRHLAYYGLAKREAEVMFASPDVSKQDKHLIERWRNDANRWQPYDQLWEKIASITKVPPADLHFLLIDEVKKLLNGHKINLQTIAERRIGIWSLVIKNKTLSLHLQDLRPVTASGKFEQVIKGQPGYFASRSVIKGIVGKDILVAVMTRPEMINEIKSARAVITDEGGILSHAAITCRELKIPCVIGTKIATQMLNDGDAIAVDAMNGVVTILG